MSEHPRAVLTLRVEGEMWSDLTAALEEVKRHIDDGNVSALDSNETGRYSMEIANPEALDWDERNVAADRASAALQAHVDAVNGAPGVSYGDEGSDTFREAVVCLLTDLKHLLYRADPHLELTDLADTAVNRWAGDEND